MADLGGDEGSLIMGPFDPSAFTGRDEDLILPGDSLFGFSSAAGLGASGASLQCSPSLLSPPMSFQASASVPSPGSNSNTGFLVKMLDHAKGDSSKDNSGVGVGGSPGKRKASGPSLLEMLEAAVSAVDSHATNDPPAKRKKAKGGCETSEGNDDTVPQRNRKQSSSSSSSPSPSSGGGRREVSGTPSRRNVGRRVRPKQQKAKDPKDATAGSARALSGHAAAAQLPTTSKRNESLVGDGPSQHSYARRGTSSSEGSKNGESAAAAAKRSRDEGPARRKKGTAGQVSLMQGRKGSGEVGHTGWIGNPAAATTASGSSEASMPDGMELIPGFEDTIDAHYMKTLLHGSDTQAAAPFADTEEGEGDLLDPLLVEDEERDDAEDNISISVGSGDENEGEKGPNQQSLRMRCGLPDEARQVKPTMPATPAPPEPQAARTLETVCPPPPSPLSPPLPLKIATVRVAQNEQPLSPPHPRAQPASTSSIVPATALEGSTGFPADVPTATPEASRENGSSRNRTNERMTAKAPQPTLRSSLPVTTASEGGLPSGAPSTTRGGLNVAVEEPRTTVRAPPLSPPPPLVVRIIKEAPAIAAVASQAGKAEKSGEVKIATPPCIARTPLPSAREAARTMQETTNSVAASAVSQAGVLNRPSVVEGTQSKGMRRSSSHAVATTPVATISTTLNANPASFAKPVRVKSPDLKAAVTEGGVADVGQVDVTTVNVAGVGAAVASPSMPTRATRESKREAAKAASHAGSRLREVAAGVQSSCRPLPRKAALRFTPRDLITEEKLAQRGYNPAQQLKAPLYKPVDAVFKFMVKKWSEVPYVDLQNIRIVFEAEVTAPTFGVPSEAFVWDATRGGESLIDLVNSMPEATRMRVCTEEILDLTYTFVPGPLGPREATLLLMNGTSSGVDTAASASATTASSTPPSQFAPTEGPGMPIPSRERVNAPPLAPTPRASAAATFNAAIARSPGVLGHSGIGEAAAPGEGAGAAGGGLEARQEAVAASMVATAAAAPYLQKSLGAQATNNRRDGNADANRIVTKGNEDRAQSPAEEPSAAITSSAKLPPNSSALTVAARRATSVDASLTVLPHAELGCPASPSGGAACPSPSAGGGKSVENISPLVGQAAHGELSASMHKAAVSSGIAEDPSASKEGGCRQAGVAVPRVPTEVAPPSAPLLRLSAESCRFNYPMFTSHGVASDGCDARSNGIMLAGGQEGMDGVAAGSPLFGEDTCMAVFGGMGPEMELSMKSSLYTPTEERPMAEAAADAHVPVPSAPPPVEGTDAASVAKATLLSPLLYVDAVSVATATPALSPSSAASLRPTPANDAAVARQIANEDPVSIPPTPPLPPQAHLDAAHATSATPPSSSLPQATSSPLGSAEEHATECSANRNISKEAPPLDKPREEGRKSVGGWGAESAPLLPHTQVALPQSPRKPVFTLGRVPHAFNLGPKPSLFTLGPPPSAFAPPGRSIHVEAEKPEVAPPPATARTRGKDDEATTFPAAFGGEPGKATKAAAPTPATPTAAQARSSSHPEQWEAIPSKPAVAFADVVVAKPSATSQTAPLTTPSLSPLEPVDEYIVASRKRPAGHVAHDTREPSGHVASPADLTLPATRLTSSVGLDILASEEGQIREKLKLTLSLTTADTPGGTASIGSRSTAVVESPAVKHSSPVRFRPFAFAAAAAAKAEGMVDSTASEDEQVSEDREEQSAVVASPKHSESSAPSLPPGLPPTPLRRTISNTARRSLGSVGGDTGDGEGEAAPHHSPLRSFKSSCPFSRNTSKASISGLLLGGTATMTCTALDLSRLPDPASMAEIQAGYADTWTSCPAFFWEEEQLGCANGGGGSGGQGSRGNGSAAADDGGGASLAKEAGPVTRWLDLPSTAEHTFQGIPFDTSLAAVAVNQRGANGEDKGQGHAEAPPAPKATKQKSAELASQGTSDDLAMSTRSGSGSGSSGSSRVSNAVSTRSTAAGASSTVVDEGKSLPTLIRLGRSMTKGVATPSPLPPTKETTSSTAAAGSDDGDARGPSDIMMGPSTKDGRMTNSGNGGQRNGASTRLVPDLVAKSRSPMTMPSTLSLLAAAAAEAETNGGSRTNSRGTRDGENDTTSSISSATNGTSCSRSTIPLTAGRGGAASTVTAGAVVGRPKKRAKKGRIAPTLVAPLLPPAPPVTSPATPRTIEAVTAVGSKAFSP